jgi:hypothetical protein
VITVPIRMSAGSVGLTITSVPGGNPGSMELVRMVYGVELVAAGTTTTSAASRSTKASRPKLMPSPM